MPDLDGDLLALVACPACHGPLTAEEKALRCPGCRRDYPIEDGIPNFA